MLDACRVATAQKLVPLNRCLDRSAEVLGRNLFHAVDQFLGQHLRRLGQLNRYVLLHVANDVGMGVSDPPNDLRVYAKQRVDLGRRIAGCQQVQQFVLERQKFRTLADRVRLIFVFLVTSPDAIQFPVYDWRLNNVKSPRHMNDGNIIEIKLTGEQRVAFAAVLRAAHLPGTKHQATIMTVLTDSYVNDDQSSVLRLQVAVVDWKTGTKVAGILADKALPVSISDHFS